jgi:hypothetical protein
MRMSDRGFFAIDRGAWDHPLFAKEKFSEREAWFWLLSNAVWADTRVRIGKQVIDLKRGQLAFATRFLATKWMWAHSKVVRYLKRLETDTMVSTLATRDATLITICNYDKYQSPRNASETLTETPSETPAKRQRNKEEQINNLTNKQITKEKRARAKPRHALPDLWQVDQQDFDYARSKGFEPAKIREMAGAFINHHRAKATMSADWHASWRTWCDNEIKFNGGTNGNRTRNQGASGHDAILAVAARKARELDRNDTMAGAAGAPGFAFGDGPDTAGQGGHRGSAEAGRNDHERQQSDAQRVREGEIIPPDKNAAGFSGRRQFV